MSEFSLQIMMAVFVWVNTLDWTEFRYWFKIPADIESYMRILKEEIKLPIAEIKAELWEYAFCAMSNQYESTDNEVLKIMGRSADRIDSATVEVHIESMAYVGTFKKGLLEEDSNFRGWSPILHNVIEKEIGALREDLLGMIVAMAEAYYNDSDGGGDSRYELRRNNQTKQTDA